MPNRSRRKDARGPYVDGDIVAGQDQEHKEKDLQPPHLVVAEWLNSGLKFFGDNRAYSYGNRTVRSHMYTAYQQWLQEQYNANTRTQLLEEAQHK